MVRIIVSETISFHSAVMCPVKLRNIYFEACINMMYALTMENAFQTQTTHSSITHSCGTNPVVEHRF